MAVRQRMCSLMLYNLKPRVIGHKKQYFTHVTCPFFSRATAFPCSRFSTSSRAIKYQKTSKDQPVAFSKSKAKLHTVDDTLGITKSKRSNIPLYLGLGLFSIIIYFGFVRKESNSSPESLEELLEKIRISHEEKKLKTQTVNVNGPNNGGGD